MNFSLWDFEDEIFTDSCVTGANQLFNNLSKTLFFGFGEILSCNRGKVEKDESF